MEETSPAATTDWLKTVIRGILGSNNEDRIQQEKYLKSQKIAHPNEFVLSMLAILQGTQTHEYLSP